MRSPLNPTLGNVIIGYFENWWLKNCPLVLKSNYRKRYDDKIFDLFALPEQLQGFCNFAMIDMLTYHL